MNASASDRYGHCTPDWFMSERNENVAALNPFARRPVGVGLSFRERLGVVALYLGLALFIGQHLVRSMRSSTSVAGRSPAGSADSSTTVASRISASPVRIALDPTVTTSPLDVSRRRPR